MKTVLLLSSLIIGLLCNRAHAQGYVVFANTSTTRVFLDERAAAALGLPSGAPVPAGTAFKVSLFYAPAEDAELNALPDPGDAGMMDVMGFAPTFFVSGRFNGGYRSTPNSTLPLRNAWFQVRAWEAAFGTNYEEAVNAPAQTINGVTRYAISGRSQRFNIATGTESQPLPLTQPGGFTSFFLTIDREVPVFTIKDVVVSEGTNGTANAVFTVDLASFGQTNQTFSVDFATADGSAIAGQDYVATNGTLVFNPGETQKVVSVAVTADVPPEPEEDFFVNLTNPVNAWMSKAVGRCVVTEVRITGVSVDVSVSFNSVAGRYYVVEKSLNFSTWNPVPGATNVLGNGNIVTIQDPGAGCAPLVMYRARLLP